MSNPKPNIPRNYTTTHVLILITPLPFECVNIQVDITLDHAKIVDEVISSALIE